MKKLVVLLLAVGAISMAFVAKKGDSQTKADATMLDGAGISFQGLTFEQAKEQAKSSGKTIFIDCYTDWCGPCKKMAASTFMDEKVAELFNSKFINLKVEMEKSEDGPALARTYGVKAYPTLLFIDGTGKIKKSVIGFQTVEQLLAVGKSL